MSGSIVQFPLRLGLADDANKKSAPVSSLKRGHNVRCVREGVLGKRFGYDRLPLLPDGAGAPRRLVANGETLGCIDGDRLYTVDSEATVWADSGRVSEASLEWSTLLDEELGVASSDIAVYGDFLVHAYIVGDPTEQSEAINTGESGGGRQVFVQITNRDTGRVIVPPTALYPNGRFVRVLIVGVWAVILFANQGELRSQPIRLDVAQPVIDLTLDYSAAPIITNIRYDDAVDGINGRFDAVVLSNGKIAFAYEKPSVGLTLQQLTFSAGVLTTSGASHSLGDSFIRAIGIVEDTASSRLYVAYTCPVTEPVHLMKLGAISTSTWTGALTPVGFGEHVFRAAHISIAMSGSNVLAGWSGIVELSDNASMPQFCSCLLTPSGAAVAGTMRISSAIMQISHLFELDSRFYVLARDGHYGDATYINTTDGTPDAAADLTRLPSISSYLLEVETSVVTQPLSGTYVPHRYAGKIDHDIAAPFQAGSLPHVIASSADTVYALVPFQATASPISVNLRIGLRLARVSVAAANATDPWRSVSFQGEVYLSGAFMGAWAGAHVFDYGMRTPYVASWAAVATGGSIGMGAYIYQAHASYRSRAGVLHRGPMSVSVEFSLTTGYEANHGKTTIWVAPNGVDCKQNETTGWGRDAGGTSAYEVFRTVASGSVLYELTYSPTIRLFLNEPCAAEADDYQLKFIDVANDSDITNALNQLQPHGIALDSRPQPYPATGELEDVQPPASRTVCAHLGRIFSVGGDGRTLWFSKSVDDNPGVAPGFNPDFVRIFDREITALASYSDRLIIFFERGAKFMVGDGPTVANTDDRFSTPQSLQGEIGTTNPRSVVATPVGVFFQATGDELYLLDGSLAMQWIGKDVRDQLATYPTITSAVHVAEQREVRFSCSTTNGSAGIILVYDYNRGTWLTRSTPGDAAVSDAIMWRGRYTFSTTAGIYRENTARHCDVVDDASIYVPMSIVVNPIAPSGPLAWHRIRLVQLLGKSVDPHDLTIGLARDFSEDVEQERTWNGSSDVTSNTLERAQVAPRHQKMQAIEIHISDAAPTFDEGDEHDAAFNGFELEGIALLVQTKQDLARITKSRRG